MLNTVGLLALLAMTVGAGAAWLRLVPAMGGFVPFALGGIVCLVVGVTSFVQLVRGKGLTPGGGLAMVGAAVLVVAAAPGRGLPRINDFTTDLDDPPGFHKALGFPANEGRDMAYPAAFAAEQRACCADLAPTTLPLAKEAAIARVALVAASMPGWRVTATDVDTGTVEATSTTRLFGFQDDIVIRVRPAGDGGSRIDMRSKSRDGKGDLGANAARIRAFMTTLAAAK